MCCTEHLPARGGEIVERASGSSKQYRPGESKRVAGFQERLLAGYEYQGYAYPQQAVDPGPIAAPPQVRDPWTRMAPCDGSVVMTDVAERVGLAPAHVHAFTPGELEILQDFAEHFRAIAERGAISSTGSSPFAQPGDSSLGSASAEALLILVEIPFRDLGEVGLCVSQVDWAFRLAMAIASLSDMSDTVTLFPRGTGPQVEDAGTGSVWVRLRQWWPFGDVESGDETEAEVIARMQERAAQYGLEAAQAQNRTAQLTLVAALVPALLQCASFVWSFGPGPETDQPCPDIPSVTEATSKPASGYTISYTMECADGSVLTVKADVPGGED